MPVLRAVSESIDRNTEYIALYFGICAIIVSACCMELKKKKMLTRCKMMVSYDDCAAALHSFMQFSYFWGFDM